MRIFEIEDKALKYEGFVCVDTLQDGLAFGGCRFSLQVTREEVMELAKCMTLKLLAHGLPVGGAKAGLRVDPNRSDILEVVHSFADKASEVLMTQVLLGKDLGATDQLMDAMYERLKVPQLHILHRRPSSDQVPGRIRDFIGYQKHMTGLGVAWAARAAVNGKTQGKRVIIQGAGAVGAGSAVRLSELGAIIVGMSDAQKSVVCPSGLSIDSIVKAPAGGIIDQNMFPNAEIRNRDDLFGESADLLVLAANSHSVDASLASTVKVPVVVEGSNFGLRPEARKQLHSMNILVVPDIIASSSSAALVARQMRSLNQLSFEQIWRDIESAIDGAVRKCIDVARSNRSDLREAYVECFGANRCL